MIELPEALTLARQLNASAAGKTVRRVLPPTKAHKFCWYNGDPAEYDRQLAGRAVAAAEGFGIFAELSFDGGKKLCVNDGVNLRLMREESMPKDYQLAICTEDGCALVFTVAMYGGIILHGGDYDNDYYLKSRGALSPFSPDFDAYFRQTLAQSKATLSAKAFLATEQRFPGIGNGTLQDILFAARIHPKRKIATFTPEETNLLLSSAQSVLQKMTEQGGRDTEKDLYGASGGYATQMSKRTLESGCPVCGGAIVKEAYLGGSVYYCPHCQRLN